MAADRARAVAGRLRAVALGGAALVLASAFQVTEAPSAGAGGRPDLVVTAVDAPRSVVAGTPIRATVQITNKGVAPAPRSAVQLFLRYEAQDSSGQIKLGRTGRIDRLAAGRSRTVKVRRLVRQDTPFERFVLVVCVDPARRVLEKVETNNCRATTRAVAVVGARDAYARIDAAVASGQITPERGLRYKVYADVGDPALPERFGPVAPSFDDAPGLDEAAQNWDSLSAGTRAALAPHFTPPGYTGPETTARAGSAEDPCGDRPLDFTTWSSIDTEHFRIWHYTADPAPERSWLADPAVSRAAAERVAEIAEHVYDQETTLWRAPLSDAGLPCNGGDGRIDIYMVRWNARLLAQVRPYPPGAIHRPGWAYIDPKASQLRDVFAHEFAHLVQLAYAYASPDNPLTGLEFGWLEEASATWAIDYVYPGDDYEHRFDGYLRRAFTTPLGECGPIEYGDCDRGYRDWIFLYFLTQHLDPGVMTRIWDHAESAPGTVAAIDRAVGGEFASLFAEFALRGLNRADYDDFRAWDGFTPGIPFGSNAFPHTEVRLDGKARRTWPLPGSDGGGNVRHLAARSYRTDQYQFTDPDVRRVKLRDFGFGPADVPSGTRIKAWFELADGSRVTEDWTDLTEVEFCRDVAAEDIQRLVLFYIDGTPRRYLTTGTTWFPKPTGTIKAWNRCEPPRFPERWTGSASGTNTYGSITETWTATVVLKKQSWSSEYLTTYGAVPGAGTWNWTISGTTNCPGGGSRSISGSYSRAFWPTSPYDPTTTPRGEQLVLYGPDAGPLYGHSNAFHVNLNPATPEPLFNVVTLGACAGTDSEVVRSYTAMNCVRDADSDYLPYTPEMTTIAGSRSYDIDVGCGDSNPVTAKWNLTAAD